jgi:MOSC domain-containing protein YiiM
VGTLISVNVAAPRRDESRAAGLTGIDKRPAGGPVRVDVPGDGQSGVGGDQIFDVSSHGGVDQAVYAYAREDLDRWQEELGRQLTAGTFGENFTTSGIDVTGALIGERWRIGAEAVLEVTGPRRPCVTFASWMDEKRWVKRFTERGAPGAYFRVITPGAVAAGDPVEVVHRPSHDVTVGVTFRAVNREPELLPRLVGIEALAADLRNRVARRTAAGGHA